MFSNPLLSVTVAASCHCRFNCNYLVLNVTLSTLCKFPIQFSFIHLENGLRIGRKRSVINNCEFCIYIMDLTYLVFKTCVLLFSNVVVKHLDRADLKIFRTVEKLTKKFIILKCNSAHGVNLLRLQMI